jgi:hypothetical protein
MNWESFMCNMETKEKRRQAIKRSYARCRLYLKLLWFFFYTYAIVMVYIKAKSVGGDLGDALCWLGILIMFSWRTNDKVA